MLLFHMHMLLQTVTCCTHKPTRDEVLTHSHLLLLPLLTLLLLLLLQAAACCAC
jgi:hypothetical protein